jgi:hypothetical protein
VITGVAVLMLREGIVSFSKRNHVKTALQDLCSDGANGRRVSQADPD